MPGPPSPLRAIAIVLLGAAAGAVAGFAAHDLSPASLPAPPLGVTVGIAVVSTSILALLLAWRDPPRARRLFAWSVACAAAFVVVLRPFEEAPLDWRIVGNNEKGRKLLCNSENEHWGARFPRVAAFHATDRPGPDQPWRYRTEAGVRGLTALGPAKIAFHATQPESVLIDPVTHERRPGLDGVSGVVEVRAEGRWTVLGRMELEPSASSWSEVEVEVPRGSERLALSWLPRGNMQSDLLLAALDVPRATPVLGLPRWLVQRAGELVLLTLAAALAGWLARFFVPFVSRCSTVPAIRRTPPRFRLGRADAVALACILLAPLLVAVPVAPWIEAATTSVVIPWAAPEGATVAVAFGDGPGDEVPGVRIDAGSFAAELPPRPAYRISLELAAGASGVASLGDVLLLDSRDQSVAFRIPSGDFRVRAAHPATRPADETVPSRRIARLVYEPEIRIGSMPLANRIGIVWLGGACLLAAVFLVLRLVSRHATTRESPTAAPPGPVLPLAVTAILVGVAAAVWVLSVPVIVTSDTVTYLQKAEAIARTGSYETGGQAGELTRTPGYPVFLAAVLKVCGHDYTAIAVAQVLFHVGALFFAALSLRGSVRTPWLVAGIVAGGLCFSHLNFARVVISESAFTSLSLVALGCFWFARSSPPPRDTAWMLGFGCATAAAVHVRLIGVALLAIPAAAWVSGALAIRSSKGSPAARAWNVVRHSIPALLAAAIVVVSVLGWSLRNQLARGYFGFAAMVSLCDLHGDVQSGTLDPRALIPAGLYEQFVRERSRDHGFWTVWSVYGKVFDEAQAGRGVHGVIQRAEEIYATLHRASQARLPGVARLVGHLRSAWWSLGLADERDYIGGWKRPIWVQSDLAVTVEEARSQQERVESVSRIAMSGGEGRLTGLGALVTRAAAPYPMVHGLLILGAFLCCLRVLGKGRPGLAAPFLFVAANWALLSLLRQHESRYMVIMDVFCVLQIIVALGSSWRAPGSAPASSASGLGPETRHS